MGPSPSGPVYSGSSPGLSLQLQESCLQTQVSSRASCAQRLRQEKDLLCPDDFAPRHHEGLEMSSLGITWGSSGLSMNFWADMGVSGTMRSP